MVKSIGEGFDEFFSRLTPSTIETQRAKEHRASIENCLKSKFGLIRFFRSGSFGNATSIRNYSDVDYFAWIPYDQVPTNSAYFLTKIRDALDIRFPRTGVRVDSPAIVVPFGIDPSETTEIVPVQYAFETKFDIDVFNIANGNGGWLRSSPETHNSFIAIVDQKYNQKVRPLIRFVKAWKYFQKVPIQSFYLELFIASYTFTQESIYYIWDLEAIFQKLWGEELRPIADPTGVSGMVNACKTQAQLEEAKLKVLTAYVRAEKAHEAVKANKVSEAFSWLNMLYDNKFPSYY